MPYKYIKRRDKIEVKKMNCNLFGNFRNCLHLFSKLDFNTLYVLSPFGELIFEVPVLKVAQNHTNNFFSIVLRSAAFLRNAVGSPLCTRKKNLLEKVTKSSHSQTLK